MICYVLGIPFSSMKCVLIFIDVGMDLGLTFDVFVDTFTVHTCNLLNHQRNIILDDVMIFFVTSFGIDV